MNKPTIIELTRQTVPPYDFARNSTLAHDRRQAGQLLAKIREHLADFTSGTRPNSVAFINKRNRNSRIIFYDVATLLAAAELFVVVFYGNTRADLPEMERQDFFETDWKIAMSLTGSATVLCYASQELHNRDWFNIVIFTQVVGKEEVLQSETHRYAAYTLAPRRFRWIRLHNAALPDGLASDILFMKTKYYDFDHQWFAKRSYP